jgi:phosphate transport system protein
VDDLGVDSGAACNQAFTERLPSPPLSTTLSSSDPQARSRTLRAVATTLTSSEIDDEVLRMFALVADGIFRATAAFVEGDDVAARQLVADDLLVNALQHRIESSVEQRLTSGDAIGPREARSLIAVLRIVPELERTGDLVEHIALRTPRGMAAELTPQCRALVAEMGQIAAAMWLLAAEAYAHGDRSAAARLRRRDDALDDLHVSLTAQLAASDISVAVAIEMGLVARFYERLGDHAVNVARRMRGHDDEGQAIGA